MDSPHWTIEATNLATLLCGHHQWEIDLARPQLGLRVSQGSRTLGHLLQISTIPSHACRIDDSFVRRSDLMVRYAQNETDSFGFQVDLRAVERQGLSRSFAIGLDVWLSVQTQWLDSHPALSLINQVSGGTWTSHASDGASCGPDNAAAFTSNSTNSGVALMVHPSDSSQTEWVQELGSSKSQADERVTLRLFGDFLEKGVIRRARLRCLLSDQSISNSDLAEAYSQFAASPLPLTT